MGTTFSQEILERFNLKEGDKLSLLVLEDGIKLTAYDPQFEQAMKAYTEGALKYQNAMKELADG